MNRDHHDEMGLHCLSEYATMPTYGTPGSACFDISACLHHIKKVAYYDQNNNKQYANVRENNYHANGKPINQFEHNAESNQTKILSVVLTPGSRMMVPTGLVFYIPPAHTMKVFSRSGLSLKSGLSLVNGTGIIDSDYHEELFVLIENRSSVRYTILHGDRICQGELVRCYTTNMIEIETKKDLKDCNKRMGGFGSTGRCAHDGK